MRASDSGILEARDDLRFTNHPVAHVFSNIRCVEDLDSNEPIKLAIFSETNCPPPATSEFFHKRVLRRTEIRLAHNVAQMFQLVAGKPLHCGLTPSNER